MRAFHNIAVHLVEFIWGELVTRGNNIVEEVFGNV